MAPPRFCTVFAIVLALEFLAVVHGKETVRLGVLLPLTMRGYPDLGNALAHTVDTAINNVYDRGWLTRDYNLTYTIKNSACDSLKAVGKVDDLHFAHAFIGPACSSACMATALLANHRNKPIISYSCSSTELKNSYLYATFLRTQPYTRSFSFTTPSLLHQFMLKFHWSRAAIISPEDKIWAPIAISLRDRLDKSNLTVPYFGLYATGGEFKTYKTVMADAKRVSRVIFLLAFNDDVAQFLFAADELGMRNGEYAFITLDFAIKPDWKNEPWAKGIDEERLMQIFNGIINLSVKDAHGPRNAAFQQNITQTLKSNNISVSSTVGTKWLFYSLIVLLGPGRIKKFSR